MSTHISPEEAARAQAAQDALARARRDSETLLGSSTARASDPGAKTTTQGILDHFAARDAIGDAENGGTDPIELWGRRIGRSLSLIAVIILAALLGRQLKIW